MRSANERSVRDAAHVSIEPAQARIRRLRRTARGTIAVSEQTRREKQNRPQEREQGIEGNRDRAKRKREDPQEGPENDDQDR